MIPEILAWKSKLLNPKEEKEICLRCGWMAPLVKDMTRVMGEGEIKAGALVVCGYCGYVSKLNEHLRWRELTAEELQALQADSEAWATMQRIKQFLFDNRRREARFN
jgi:ribosomal protein S27AE